MDTIVKGCHGLPRVGALEKRHHGSRSSYRITFQTLNGKGAPWVDSRIAQLEGRSLARGTVYWHESIDL